MEELFYVTADQDTSPICVADVAQRPLLVPAPTSGTQRVVQELFRKHGISIASIGEINTLSALRLAIAGGVGNAIMSWAALHDSGQEKTLNYRRFTDAEMVRPISLCYSEVGARTSAMAAIAQTLKSLVREVVANGTWQEVSLIEPSWQLEHAPIPKQVARRQ